MPTSPETLQDRRGVFEEEARCAEPFAGANTSAIGFSAVGVFVFLTFFGGRRHVEVPVAWWAAQETRSPGSTSVRPDHLTNVQLIKKECELGDTLPKCTRLLPHDTVHRPFASAASVPTKTPVQRRRSGSSTSRRCSSKRGLKAWCTTSLVNLASTSEDEDETKTCKRRDVDGWQGSAGTRTLRWMDIGAVGSGRTEQSIVMPWT